MKQFIFILITILLLQYVYCKKYMDFDFFKVNLHGETRLLKSLNYPQTMEKITLSNLDVLEVTFKLVEKEDKSKEINRIEQAMFYLSNDKSQNSYIFEDLTDGNYRIKIKNLSIDNGDYSMIVRLSSPTKDYVPLEYKFGNVEVKYTHPEKKVDPNKAPTLMESEAPNFYPKPDQPHIFKPDPKAPNKFLAVFFFILMFVPWAFLLIMWSKIGININGLFYNNKTFIYGVLFIISLCSIIGILVLFFVKLNLFQTLGALGVAAIYTSVFGHLVLRQKADKRSNERKMKKSSTKKEKDTKSE